MNEVYIKKEELNSWVAKQFTKDLISIDDLICCIEDLASELEKQKDLYQDLESDYINLQHRKLDFKEYGE